MNMTSKKNKNLKVEIPPEMSGLLQRHHDVILADNSLIDVDVILLCIYLIENTNKKAGVDYKKCKEMFISLGRKEDNFRGNLSSAKKKSLIGERNGQLSLLIGGLKRIRQILGQIGKTPVYIIRSGENISAIKLFEEFLTAQIENDDLQLCDSHISHSTLFPFTILKGRIKSFKILTANIHDPAKFRDYKKRMVKELGIPVEVKVNNKIHDRFLISGDHCWSIGSSIKDFGNKDTIVREISEVVASMKDLFEERWNGGSLFS